MEHISSIDLNGLGLLKFKSKYSDKNNLVYGASPFSARIRYQIKTKSLNIQNIINFRRFKIKGITKLICESMVNTFDINSICFENLIEDSTYDVLEKINFDNFNLNNYKSIIATSPFLRTLNELGFNEIKMTSGNYLENLTGYRR